ncbi:TPA: Na+/Pi symporter [Trebouxia sp. C0006]
MHALALLVSGSHDVGANLLANVWGPVLGAKVVKYRTAVLIAIAGQVVGIVIFGPRTASVYNGILYDWTKLKHYPELTLYAMAWAEVTLVTWQYLAIWKQVLIPVYLGAVASTIGAAFVFPGVGDIDGGTSLSAPPFLSGLGPVFLIWLVAPTLTLTLVILLFLMMRTYVMRGEDPFHKVLWVMPALSCFAAIIWTADLFYAVGSAQGLQVITWSPQGVVVLLLAVGTASCIVTCLLIPRMMDRLKTRGPSVLPIKRINLLGLDEVTLRELAADDRSSDMRGWLQRTHAWLFGIDIFASVASDDALLRIHSTAEEFEGAAEELLVWPQIITCTIISIAYGANNARTSVGMFTLMYHIHSTGTVTGTAPISTALRGVGAVGMSLGTLLCGYRLAPVTGAQIAKLTPFRSYVVTLMTALSLTIMSLLKFKGGTITYAVPTAVAAVGLVEGSSHVNWKKVFSLLVWWIVGFAVVMGSTSLVIAQGIYAPSAVSTAASTD